MLKPTASGKPSDLGVIRRVLRSQNVRKWILKTQRWKPIDGKGGQEAGKLPLSGGIWWGTGPDQTRDSLKAGTRGRALGVRARGPSILIDGLFRKPFVPVESVAGGIYFSIFPCTFTGKPHKK